MTGFSMRRKAVGAYFNDGEMIAACQVLKDHEDAPAPKLLASVSAARDVFFALYNEESGTANPEVLSRLKQVIADIRDESLAQGARLRDAAGKE